ncbi:hypothetical protein psal_cds_90 [Pandoravirus salinus]|uniref:Uncharacterized protein n=1 Tax=Pandoravirus salinus TaxID=1349410 RepID=S4VZP9_9VIRU|nr:hypothetical protein psal_cds_90 [Pandoravirus salinus]AGO83517.1 hypothetical protein psal_cds_90 [Pandoravirus salinus]
MSTARPSLALSLQPADRARSTVSPPKRRAKATAFASSRVMLSASKAKAAMLAHKERQRAIRREAVTQDMPQQLPIRTPPVRAGATSDHRSLPHITPPPPPPCRPDCELQVLARQIDDDELARQLAAVEAAIEAISRRLAERGRASLVVTPHSTQAQQENQRRPYAEHPVVSEAATRLVPMDDIDGRHSPKQQQQHNHAGTSDAVDRHADDDDDRDEETEDEEDMIAPWPVPRVLVIDTSQEPVPAVGTPPVFWWD